jgi:hypothetical protein
LFPLDPDLQDSNTAIIHWYWFDKRSVHRLDKPLEVTANDVVTIDWADAAASSGIQYDGVAGYMVVGTETARRGEAANFDMFGDAWLAMDVTALDGTEAVLASIPVYPLSDGADAEEADGDPLLTIADSVHYKGGIPDAVSPLISGMRTNRSDDIPDLTAFDLTLLSRLEPSMHVIWLDKNLDEIVDIDGDGVVDKYSTDIPVDVYDSDEVACSATVSIENELNVIWIDEIGTDGIPVEADEIFFAQTSESLCIPNYEDAAGLNVSSFVTYYIDEYVDTAADRPESAGVAFTLIWATEGDNDVDLGPWSYTAFGQTMLLGHERGLFRQ